VTLYLIFVRGTVSKCMDFTAESVSKKAITIKATDSLSDARDFMLKHNISRIVVVRK
jgi:CBS domain-containing protein